MTLHGLGLEKAKIKFGSTAATVLSANSKTAVVVAPPVYYPPWYRDYYRGYEYRYGQWQHHHDQRKPEHLERRSGWKQPASINGWEKPRRPTEGFAGWSHCCLLLGAHGCSQYLENG